MRFSMHQLIRLLLFYTAIVTRVDRNFNLINSWLDFVPNISRFTFEFYVSFFFFSIFLKLIFAIYFRSRFQEYVARVARPSFRTRDSKSERTREEVSQSKPYALCTYIYAVPYIRANPRD